MELTYSIMTFYTQHMLMTQLSFRFRNAESTLYGIGTAS